MTTANPCTLEGLRQAVASIRPRPFDFLIEVDEQIICVRFPKTTTPPRDYPLGSIVLSSPGMFDRIRAECQKAGIQDAFIFSTPLFEVSRDEAMTFLAACSSIIAKAASTEFRWDLAGLR